MKKLRDILFGVQIERIQGSTLQTIESMAFDSRKVQPKSLFVAIKGEEADGHQYIAQAVAQGATAVVCQEKPSHSSNEIVWIETQNSREALAILAANFYDRPASKLHLIGVTGTNGKTTITSLLYALFSQMGYATGLFSTIAVKYGGVEQPASHTTPDPLAINKHLHQMVKAGVDYCFMEVSSHGIDQERIQGLTFSGGVFTNLTQDHLDYHPTFAAYRDVKKRFFDQLPSSAFALANIDDKNGRYMLQNTSAKQYSYGLKNYADYQAKLMEMTFDGMLIKIDHHEIWSTLIGRFNASNLLAVYAVTQLLKIPQDEVLSGLSNLKNVKGRFQTYITPNKATIVVDYAHTPDALENVLSTIDQIRTRNERLITLVGCGGERDIDKRPLMAKTAAMLSDKVIFTADNPRSEDPEVIIDQMEKGVPPEHYKKTLRIVNRAQAIKAACMELVPGDVLLVAGKGHETYQEINGVKIPFDDFKMVKNICEQLF